MLDILPGAGAEGLNKPSLSSPGALIPVHVSVYGGRSRSGKAYVLVTSDSDKGSGQNIEQGSRRRLGSGEYLN